MIVTGTTANVYLRAPVRQRPRVELLSPCNELDMGTPQGAHTPSMNRRNREHPLPRHFETVSQADPLQTSLNSAFAAQILGQVMVTKTLDPERAQRAYAEAQHHKPTPQLLRFA
jgi:hypothetical protein